MNDITDLAAWNSFFIIVGSSAGALIWIAVRRYGTNCREISTTWGRGWSRICYTDDRTLWCRVALSAVQSAPWQEVTFVAAILDLMGLSGVVYIFTVARQMGVQTEYEPEFGELVVYALLPLAAYAMLALSAFMALSLTREALFGIGAAALLLLFIGIHNAWDSVTYLVFYSKQNINNKRG